MGKEPKRKSKPNKKSQRDRFIETARILETDESGKSFANAVKRILPPRAARRNKSGSKKPV